MIKKGKNAKKSSGVMRNLGTFNRKSKKGKNNKRKQGCGAGGADEGGRSNVSTAEVGDARTQEDAVLQAKKLLKVMQNKQVSADEMVAAYTKLAKSTPTQKENRDKIVDAKRAFDIQIAHVRDVAVNQACIPLSANTYITRTHIYIYILFS